MLSYKINRTFQDFNNLGQNHIKQNWVLSLITLSTRFSHNPPQLSNWQIDSKLLCVCSVIDHRWRQNVVRTKKWHTRHSQVCHWSSYHILTSSVIYYWTDAWQLGIYLFYIIKNLKSFNDDIIYTSVLQ